MFFINKEPKGKEYRNLIEYALSKSDAVMFVVRRDRYIYCKDYEIIKSISNILNVDINEFIKNYKIYIQKNYTILLKNIYKLIGNQIWMINHIHESENKSIEEATIEILIKNVEGDIESTKNYYIQKERITQLKNKLKEYKLKERHNPQWMGTEVFVSDEIKKNEYKYDNEYIFDICIYRKCDEIRKFLLESVDALYKFDPPNFPEDITFLKDGYAILHTITHEDDAEIYIKDKEEYDILTKIGIKLEAYSDEYIGGQTWYEEY